jgi:hypothetical protein
VRVTPVTSAGRANVRRKRSSLGETETERKANFASHLPVPVEPTLEQAQEAFVTHYRPNSTFLAHLIATRDSELQESQYRQSETLSSVNTYRATAALPRQRSVGHLLSTER